MSKRQGNAEPGRSTYARLFTSFNPTWVHSGGWWNILKQEAVPASSPSL